MSLFNQTIFNSEHISFWHKNLDSVFVEIEGCLFKSTFGVKNIKTLIGKTDYDFPYISEKLAELFRENDSVVIAQRQTSKFLEIYQKYNQDWVVVSTTKSPYVKDNKILGTFGFCTILPKSILKLGQLFSKALRAEKQVDQVSFAIKPISDALTRRENEVLFFLLRGRTAKEIASVLSLSSRTVEHYIDSIKSKLHCKHKRELMEFSMEKEYDNVVPETLITHNLSILL